MGAAATLGIDPTRILRADPIELPVLIETIKCAHEHAERRDRNLARMIINEYAEATKRGRR